MKYVYGLLLAVRSLFSNESTDIEIKEDEGNLISK